MNCALVTEQECSVTLSGITVWVDSYEVSAEKKFAFQPMAYSGIRFRELGRYPAVLKIKGRILKSDGTNPAVQLNTDMTNSTIFYITMDNLYFNHSQLRSFHIETETNSQFNQCSLEFYCDSYISGVDS